jgi:hypothetical protein
MDGPVRVTKQPGYEQQLFPWCDASARGGEAGLCSKLVVAREGALFDRGTSVSLAMKSADIDPLA